MLLARSGDDLVLVLPNEQTIQLRRSSQESRRNPHREEIPAWRVVYLLSALFNSFARDALKMRLFRSAVEPIRLEAIPMTPARKASSVPRSIRRLHFPSQPSGGAGRCCLWCRGCREQKPPAHFVPCRRTATWTRQGTDPPNALLIVLWSFHLSSLPPRSSPSISARSSLSLSLHAKEKLPP